MANDAADQGSLLRSITRMLDSTINEGTNFESIIPVLSLVCLASILNRSQPSAPQAASVPAANPLQKLLGDLSKGEGGLGPDTLMSLLPLLNSPQMKNKLNPATISAVLGLLNNMGDKSDKTDKNDKNDKVEKQEKSEKQEKNERSSERNEDTADAKRSAPPAAAVTSLEAIGQRSEPLDPLEADKKGLGRYLNWKSNF